MIDEAKAVAKQFVGLTGTPLSRGTRPQAHVLAGGANGTREPPTIDIIR